jgi:uncharacterized protein
VPGYFIDTSGLAKLYHTEVGSQQMEMLAQSLDNRLIVSQLSVIELQATLNQLRGLFFADLAAGRFKVVLMSGRYFRSADRLIRTHAVTRALRTLDALQLAVALELHRRGAVSALVASDRNLCEVAAEGMQVVNPIQLP